MFDYQTIAWHIFFSAAPIKKKSLVKNHYNTFVTEGLSPKL
jgi:hypothetical protein